MSIVLSSLHNLIKIVHERPLSDVTFQPIDFWALCRVEFNQLIVILKPPSCICRIGSVVLSFKARYERHCAESRRIDEAEWSAGSRFAVIRLEI